MPDLRIEPMRVEDVDEVLGIERASFPHPWSRHAFLYELRDNRVARLWVARPAAGDAATVIGYVCLWLIADEVHITNVAVDPAHRQQGIGRRLLGAILELYRRQGARVAALEVRPSNHEARRLYESFGFRQVGVRKGYYFDTGEDAVLMEAALLAKPAPAPPRGRAAGNSRAG
ncbi:MAG: ribosomal protein S18-alanine N-acetyltransferase [Candidatus Rokuibacteriota bacterium]